MHPHKERKKTARRFSFMVLRLLLLLLFLHPLHQKHSYFGEISKKKKYFVDGSIISSLNEFNNKEIEKERERENERKSKRVTRAHI